MPLHMGLGSKGGVNSATSYVAHSILVEAETPNPMIAVSQGLNALALRPAAKVILSRVREAVHPCGRDNICGQPRFALTEEALITMERTASGLITFMTYMQLQVVSSEGIG